LLSKEGISFCTITSKRSHKHRLIHYKLVKEMTIKDRILARLSGNHTKKMHSDIFEIKFNNTTVIGGRTAMVREIPSRLFLEPRWYPACKIIFKCKEDTIVVLETTTTVCGIRARFPQTTALISPVLGCSRVLTQHSRSFSIALVFPLSRTTTLSLSPHSPIVSPSFVAARLPSLSCLSSLSPAATPTTTKEHVQCFSTLLLLHILHSRFIVFCSSPCFDLLSSVI